MEMVVQETKVSEMKVQKVIDVLSLIQWRRQGGARGGGCPPPILKKMVLVILPNSMRKLRGVGIHLRCEKIINTKYF